MFFGGLYLNHISGGGRDCGGPIIAPESKNLIITPIAPHNLNVRPMVLPDDVTIKLVAEGVFYVWNRSARCRANQ